MPLFNIGDNTLSKIISVTHRTIIPLIKLKLNNYTSEQLTEFAQVLEKELVKLSQDIEEEPIKGKDDRKAQRRKLKKILRKVKQKLSNFKHSPQTLNNGKSYFLFVSFTNDYSLYKNYHI